MYAVAKIQVFPFDSDIPVGAAMEHAVETLDDLPLTLEAYGLAAKIGGDIQDVMEAVEAVHSALHQRGVRRVGTAIKLQTRTGLGDRVVPAAARMH